MKLREELEQLYESQLKPSLEKLEDERKAVLLAFTWCVLNAVVVAGLFLLSVETKGPLFYLAIALVIPFLYLLYKASVKSNAYRAQYKQKVVKRMIALIDPDWQYAADDCITEQEYASSLLFRKSYDRYKGDDRVDGKIDKTTFAFSELHTQYKTYTQHKGKTQEHWHTIFKGLFVYADFNKEIKGQTFVFPDTAERLFGKWGQKLQGGSAKGQLIKMENPIFEKLFVVHGSDQIESRYVLTPTMMEAMVALKQKYKQELYFSFVGSRVYVAISFSDDLFEPRILKSGVRFEDIAQMNEQLSLIQVLVREMNLNTRIWTKK